MSDTSLDFLLLEILSPDNAQRVTAEKELERQSLEVPGFCLYLARHCRTLMGHQSSHAVALVALSVLKRSVTASDRAEDLEQVACSLLSDLTDIAALPGGAASAMRQWVSAVCTTVRRLAVLCALPTATPATGEATTGAIMAQLLGAFDHYLKADAGGIPSMFIHVWLLRTIFEEPVLEVMHTWHTELLLNCVPPLFEILCTSAAATLTMASTDSSAFTADSPEAYARCSLMTLIAQTLAALYEWLFVSCGRKRFPAELKQRFLSAYPLLQPFMLTPCARWLSLCADATSTSALPCVQARAANYAAASLAVLECVSSVLQLGGWYKRCLSAQLFQALLQSLDADAAYYAIAVCVGGEEEAESLTGGAVWSGWWHTGSNGGEHGDDALSHDWTTVVRRRAIQCWSLFREAAFLPFLKVGLVDVVGHQCGLQYYKLLLAYAIPSPADVGVWLHDPNTFLREEEEREDGVRWSTRNIVAQLYAESITALGPLFLHASLEDLHERLLAPISDNNGRTCNNEQTPLSDDDTTMLTASQQQREAALLFMETVLKHRARELRECGAVDFTPLATHLWSNDVASAVAHPGLTARALLLIIAIVRFTQATLASTTEVSAAATTEAAAKGFMATIVADSVRALSLFTGTSKETAAVSWSSRTPLVAVLLCRVLQSTLPYWPDALFAQHSVPWQVSLLALLSPEAGLADDALYDAVEQLADLLKVAHAARKRGSQFLHGSTSTVAAAPLMLDALPRAVMDCWRRHVSDPSFADAVLGLLRHVVRDDQSGASLLLQELPWVSNVISGYTESTAELCAVPYFLRLLKYLFEHSPDEVANSAAAMMLDSLCQLLLCTEESQILGASSSCLAALLRRCLSVQSVKVHVVTSTMETAMAGGAAAEGSLSGAVGITALATDAPRAAYPFSTVIVACVLRTLDDRRDEASLMDVGDALVSIMQKSTSFSEEELIRVIHATVRRLSIVRTDTVAQQLLAPLATLMALHPAALLRTLAQEGFLVETMSRWLPKVEHFSNLRSTFASCEGLLKMLSCLSQSSSSRILTEEEARHLAHQPVTCHWKLPEELTVGKKGSRKESQKDRKRGSAAATRRAILSSLSPGTLVETSLPLYAAVLVGVGRGLLTLLTAPVSALYRASQAAGDTTTSVTGVGAMGFPSDEDDDDSNGLFRETSMDNSDGEAEDTWEEDADSVSEGEAQSDTWQSEALDINAYSPEATDRQCLLRPMGAQMLPWMQMHGDELVSFFTVQEAQALMAFFTTCTSTGVCNASAM